MQNKTNGIGATALQKTAECEWLEVLHLDGVGLSEQYQMADFSLCPLKTIFQRMAHAH